MENKLKTSTITVELSGSSLKSKEDAVNNAFSSMRAKIAEKSDAIIVGIRPTAIEVVKLQTQPYTERFLFLFFPRKKEKVVITMKVQAELQTLEI